MEGDCGQLGGLGHLWPRVGVDVGLQNQGAGVGLEEQGLLKHPGGEGEEQAKYAKCTWPAHCLLSHYPLQS